MNKLPLFKLNEVKHFKFTKIQIIDLEIEYIRYILYKELITQIEKLLNITDQTPRKSYENKNIIERFVMECINHGITPHMSYCQISLETQEASEDKMDKLKMQLFFNPVLNNTEDIQNTDYFKKMINEYIEKKIIVHNQKNIILAGIATLLMNANIKFIIKVAERINMINGFTTQTSTPTGINEYNPICNIALISSDTYIIKYRDYSKLINFSRYYNLIKNYDRPFPYDFIKMILRYAIFDTSTQQWSIGGKLYDTISQLFEINFEMFASPLNFNLNMFCSIFIDTDKLFGSVGSFYNIHPEFILNKCIRGVIYNPPYIASLLDNTTQICIQLLQEMERLNREFTIISFLPHWLDAHYIQYFLKSPYIIAYKSMKKGTYMLHEKDQGKLIKGTFDLLVIMMNSRKKYMDDEKYVDASNKFKIMIKNMKNETESSL